MMNWYVLFPFSMVKMKQKCWDNTIRICNHVIERFDGEHMIAKQGIAQRKKILFVFFLCLTCVTLCLVSVFIKSTGSELLDEEQKNYLKEISNQTSYSINQEVKFNHDTLKFLTRNLATTLDEDEMVQNVVDESPFLWIGFIDASGILHVKNHEDINIASLSVMKDVNEGKAAVSETLLDLDNEQGVLYVYPLKNRGTDISIAGYVPVSEMELLFNTDTFDGIGFSHIIDKDGNFILRSKNENGLLHGNNIYDDLNREAEFLNGATLTTLKDSIEKGKEGYLSYEIGDETRSMMYIPISDTGWYLLGIIPPDIQNANLQTAVSQAMLLFGGTILLLSVAYLIIILIFYQHRNNEMQKIAYSDPVTGGISKLKFEYDIQDILEEGIPFTLMVLDIKKFKLINNMFGSVHGDLVLKHIYYCIANNLLENEYVCRDNADHFDILLRTNDPDAIRNRLSRISEDINAFNEQREQPYYISVDCSCCIVEDHEKSLVKIIDYANIARKNRHEKESHPLWSIVFYNDIISRKLQDEKEMENHMKLALENDEFVIFLQPKVELEKKEIIGAEALVRWTRPDQGIIPPDTFIPLFEKNGFIIELDLYVFRKVCEMLRKWMDEGRKLIPVSVNLSRDHLHFDNFLLEYKKIQEEYDIPGSLIELELTESIAIDNLELLKKVIDEIHSLGYSCSMDDFGSGYSSLNVLKEVPVDILKIDRIFFNREDDERGNMIIRSIISLAKDLSMVTVAEGVETESQMNMLKDMKCDIIQGYVFSRPVDIDAFEAMMDEGDFHSS